MSQANRLQEGRFSDSTCNDTRTSYAYTMLLRVISDVLSINVLLVHIIVNALACVSWSSMTVIKEGSVSESYLSEIQTKSTYVLKLYLSDFNVYTAVLA
jgi:hypothetical protein